MASRYADISALKAFLAKLSPRERWLGLAALVVVFLMAFTSLIVKPFKIAFAEQSSEFTELTTTYDVVPEILSQYGKLVARRKEIEGFYEKIDLKSDPLTYIERLLKDVAQVPAGAYSVTPRDGVPLGERYAHKMYSVQFETTNQQSLAKFLKELTTGSQPMLLSQINVDKRLSSESLRVQLEVSGFAALS